MRQQLERLTSGTLDEGGNRMLFCQHARHFTRRVLHLDRSFFPGCEKSPDSVQSLCHHAYSAFLREPRCGGRTAFVRALDFRSPERFLYYWQDSATIRFLRDEGSELLQLRSRIRRNVHLNLRTGFTAVGTRSGQTLWSLPEWTSRNPTWPPVDVENLWVSLEGRRGRAQIRAVLEAAEVPLTRAQIAQVIEHSSGFATEIPTEHREATVAAHQEAGLVSREVRAQARTFYEGLTTLERRMLVARGYTAPGREQTCFRKVAERIGGRTQESFRQKERRIFAAFRSRFEPEEIQDAVRCLVEWLESDEDLES